MGPRPSILNNAPYNLSIDLTKNRIFEVKKWKKKEKAKTKNHLERNNYILFSDFKYLTINFNVAILPVCSVVKYSEYPKL
jgi:hypothetical protein